MPDKERFPIQLKKARKYRKLSQSDVAGKLNKHVTTFGKWELGINEPNVSEAASIAKILDLPVEYLFSNKNPGAVSLKGYKHYRNFFTEEETREFEEAVVSIYKLQARKIDVYRSKVDLLEGIEPFAAFCAIYEMMEKDDKEALYQVQSMLPHAPKIRRIFNEKFLDICQQGLSCGRDNLFINGPALFVNRPDTERLLYKWHSEAHYYPKRRNFLNIWFPVFNRKTYENGSMSFKAYSHEKDFPFADYKGFNKDSENKANHFVQYEIPESLLKDYIQEDVEADPTDLIVFDRRMVHRSNQNLSDTYSLAVVASVWNPEHDLTLTGAMEALPYGGNLGRSGLTG